MMQCQLLFVYFADHALALILAGRLLVANWALKLLSMAGDLSLGVAGEVSWASSPGVLLPLMAR